MKRYYLFIFLVTICNYLDAQSSTSNVPSVSKSCFDYEEIVLINRPKSVLWINLKRWISSNFESYKHVVDMEDKEAGIIILKWSSEKEYPHSRYWTASYEATYQIDIRDNKYRIKIYNSNAHTLPDIDDKLDYMSTASIKEARNQMQTVLSIYGYLKDENKIKLNCDYLELMQSVGEYEPIMSSIKKGYDRFTEKILSSLYTAMYYVDDF